MPASALISIPCRKPLSQGEEIIFIIKPEKIELSKTRKPCDIGGRISGVSYLGSAFSYEVDIGALRLEAVDTKLNYESRCEIGDAIFLGLNPDEIKILRS